MMPANISDGLNFDWVGAYTRSALHELHEKNCQLAKYLHETIVIYALYGALDGLSLSYSTTKYWFDMLVASTSNRNAISSDLMHNWMLTPEGLAVIITETVFLVGFSILANIIDDEERLEFLRYKVKIDDGEPLQDKQLSLYLENGIIRCMAKNKNGIIENFVIKDEYLGHSAEEIKTVIAAKSPFSSEQLETIIEATLHRNNVPTKYNIYVGVRYVRDLLKALKNSYKGIRATMWAANCLKGDIRFLLFPTALAFGLIAGANRIWYRSMKDDRKMIQSMNKILAQNVRELETLSREEAERFLNKIGSKSSYSRAGGLLSQVFGGLVDGLYLYMGALLLAPVAPLAFTFLLSCSTLFVVLCIVTRVYTEYEYQRKLVASEWSAKLAICGKRMESLFVEMQETLVGSDEQLTDNKLKTLNAELETELNNFALAQQGLWNSSVLSPSMVVLAGLRDGLAAGGAVGSFMYAVVTISAMLAVPCPPAFIITCMAISLALLVAGLAGAIIANCNTSINRPEAPPQCNAIRGLLTELKAKKIAVANLDLTEAKKEIWDDMTMDPSPYFFWQEWSEVLRSLMSAIAKAQKGVDFTFNSLQEVDEDGHSHESQTMVWLTFGYAVVFAIVFALRAVAREFNGKAPAEKNMAPPPASLASDADDSPEDSDIASLNDSTFKSLAISNPLTKNSHFSSTFSHTLLASMSLFSPSPVQKIERRRALSENSFFERDDRNHGSSPFNL